MKTLAGDGKDVEGGTHGQEKGSGQVVPALGQHQRQTELEVHGEGGRGAGIGRRRRGVLRGQGDEEGRQEERGVRTGHPGVDVQQRGAVQGAQFRRGGRIVEV